MAHWYKMGVSAPMSVMGEVTISSPGSIDGGDRRVDSGCS
jgi:hypothetical protein